MILTRRSSDLFDFIRSSPYFPESTIKTIFKQLVEAVLYLHSNGYVHRDIKDENVMIDSNYTTKLVDFGAADRVPVFPKDYFTSFRGSPRYCPPEMFKKPRHRGLEADIWCLGVLFFTLSFSCQPFLTTEDIINQRFSPRPIARSDELEEFMARMLDPNPTTRATIEELSQHSFLCV